MANPETIGELDGQPVQAVTLTGAHGLRLRVLTWGARLAELWVADRAGQLADIVLGHDRLADYLTTTTFAGATCGRYSNRIAGGRLTLDGRDVQLDRNEGANHLHGGAQGFDRKLWQIADLSATAVTLTAVSDDGEMGYPGRVALVCTYRIDADNRLWIEMTATTDATTVINMVNHAYFNLAGQGSGDVMGQHLTVDAQHYTPVGAGLLPTGEIRAVAGTAFDFKTPRAIGAELPNETGFDHNLCLSAPLEPRWGELLRPCAMAVDPASGRRLALWTNQPGVQLYTGGYLDGRLPGKAGQAIGRFGGFTLETQTFPDSPNQPQFPQADLRPGQTYRHLMAFDLTPAAT